MNEREFLNLVAKESSFLVAAHEMKTPLSIIRQLSLTLNDDDTEISDDERSRILHQIDITSERALRLVQDLTKISKLEDAIFELEPINSKKICHDVVSEISDVFKLHNRVIRFKNVRKNELIVANYELLRSVLMNFSDNALYSSNEKTEVEIKVSNVGEKVRISVRDFGDELPLSIWRAVKKQNHQPVQASSRPQSSGLGIFIAQSFATAMGAKIGVIRHRNGSTFYIDLNRSGQLSLL